MASARCETIDQLRAWLSEARTLELPIDEDTDLIETRVLSSLQLVEFMLFIEELSGRPVLVEGLDPDRLRTLARIHREFFDA